MHCAYALVSSGEDKYAKLAAISCATLRRVNPSAKITLVCDEVSLPLVLRSPLHVAEKFDSVVEVITGLATPMLRSRYLKINMRKCLDGDWLYMDVDTIVVRPIDRVFEIAGDLVAAADRHRGKPFATLPTYMQPYYERMGWSWPVNRYYNSGVLLMRDTRASHRMADLWMSKWRSGQQIGLNVDQPSFNSAIFDSKISVGSLPSRYNAMVSALPVLIRGASVLHMYESGGRVPGEAVSLLDHLVSEYDRSGSVDWPAIELCMKKKVPWVGLPTAKQYVRAGRPLSALARLVSRDASKAV